MLLEMDHTGRQSEKEKRFVRISDAAKFEKIHKYLKSDEDDGQSILNS